MSAPLEIRLLGGLNVAAEQPIQFPTRKTGLLFAYLAMHAGENVPRDRVKALLWSDRSEQQASGSLRRALSDLRKLLDNATAAAVIEASPTTVAMRADAVDVDALRFERITNSLSEDRWLEAATTYQGDLLAEMVAPDPAFEDWLRIERQRLRDIAINLVEHVAGTAETLRALEGVSDLANRLLRSDPACEEAHRALIVCYRKSGRTNAAIKQYAACVEALRSTLGVEPEDGTRALLDTPSLDLPKKPAIEVPAGAERAAGDKEDANDVGTRRGARAIRTPAVHLTPAPSGPAILTADVADFQSTVGREPAGRLETFESSLRMISEIVVERSGRILPSGGGLVAEFDTPLEAVESAVAIQRALSLSSADLDLGLRQGVRIGVDFRATAGSDPGHPNDGTPIADGLREAAGPAGICISAAIREAIENEVRYPMIIVGFRKFGEPAGALPVHRVEWRTPDMDLPDSGPARTVLAELPLIAVLPFMNLTDDPAHQLFAGALTEDVIRTLSHYRWFQVVARDSSFSYKRPVPDRGQAADEPDVRYVIRGSVRRAGERIRIAAQLIECEGGATLWAENFDRNLTDLFAIQDEVTQHVAGAVEPEIQLAECRRALRRETGEPGAYEAYLRGLWHHHQITADNYAQAIPWHRRAIALDPHFSRAHMALARTLWARAASGYSDDMLRDREDICASARRALELDNRDPESHYVMVGCHLMHGRLEMALAEAQRTIDLNPNFARAYLAIGWARLYMGQFELALDALEMAHRLSPRDPADYFYLNCASLASYHLGAFEQALGFGERALVSRRTYLNLVVLLASLGQLGRKEDAAILLPEIVESEPADGPLYWELMFPYVDPSHRTHLLEGVRKGGVSI